MRALSLKGTLVLAGCFLVNLGASGTESSNSALASVTLSSTSVVGGNPVTGTVTLNGAAPTSGAAVTLGSDNPAAAVSTVTVPEGQQTKTFTITTNAVETTATVKITATYSGVTKQGSLTVTPHDSNAAAAAACQNEVVKAARDALDHFTYWSPRSIADATSKLTPEKRKNTIDDALKCVRGEIHAVEAVIQSAASTLKIDPASPDWRRELLKANDANGNRLIATYTVLSGVEASLKILAADADLYELKVRAFAATIFSNLFREKPTDGYFSKSRPYLLVEISQTVTADRALDAFANIGFEGTAAVTEESAPAVIQKTNSFSGEAGLIFWPNILWFGPTHSGTVGVGIGASGGFVAVPSTVTDGSTTITDSFEPLVRASVLVRQLAGKWEGSFSEFAYQRDPRFVSHRDRLFVRGRLILSRENPTGEGHGLGGFLEGSYNAGHGLDEARITVGISLSMDKILQAILGIGQPKQDERSGGAASGKPAAVP